jgi:hypothetical protein
MIYYPHLGRNGRLGNQLFQIAGTLGLAHTYGFEVSFPSWSYQPDFNVPEELFSNQPGIPASILAAHLPKRHQIYLQDHRLFSAIADQIRTYFSPSPTMKERLRKKYYSFFNLSDKTAVHIRRTDFLNMADSYVQLGVEYYETAMRYLKTRYPETEFFIFSDDIEWCRANLKGDYHFISEIFSFETLPNGLPLGNRTDVDDLFLMTLCNHHICSNSTYAWWGAYLSQDTHPIVAKEWFGPAMSDVMMAQFLLPNWLTIDADLNLQSYSADPTEAPGLEVPTQAHVQMPRALS